VVHQRPNDFGPAGASAGVLTNNGAIQVGAKSAATAPSTTTLSGLGSTLNQGTISLANGIAGDNLTLSGRYTGGGAGRLVLEIAPTSGANISDTLTVAGVANGSTTVSLAALGPISFTKGAGTLIIQAAPGSSPTAFTLASGSTGIGLTREAIVFNAATGGYFLVTTPNAAAAEIVQFSEIRHTLWYTSQNTWSSHLGQLRDAEGPSGDAVPTGVYSWGQVLGGVHNRSLEQDFGVGDSRYLANESYDQAYEGVQLGFELLEQLSRGSAVLGVTGGYVNSRATFSATSDHLDLNEFTIGTYANYTGPLFFINVLMKFDAGSMQIHSPFGGFDRSLNTRQFGGTLELGHRFAVDGWYLEPLASLSAVRGFIARGGSDEHLNTLDLFGVGLQFPTDQSGRGALSLRVSSDSMQVGGWAVAPSPW